MDKNELYDKAIRFKPVYDSRKADKNSIFIALKGAVFDGHDYVLNAYENGCRHFVLQEDKSLPADADIYISDNCRKELSHLSKIYFSSPDEEMTCIGITGTKGKTSVANILYQALNFSERQSVVIGTNGARYMDVFEKTANTTPESFELFRILRNAKDMGAELLVMECSSIGFKTHRLDDIKLDIGVFTNISRDHIGKNEHENFDDYLNSKMMIKKAEKLIINFDDEKLYELFKNEDVLSFGKNPYSSFHINNIKTPSSLSNPYSSFTLNNELYLVKALSEHEIQNYAAAVSVLKILNYSYEKIKSAIRDISVQGRLEIIELNKRYFIIDYAHNRVSLSSTLKSLLRFKKNRIISIFGSVGGRSFERRKELAQESEKYSDISIISSDNPDFEDADKIINEIKSYFKSTPMCEKDRAKAIKKAYDISEEGDIILIAGKGHEDFQLIEGKKIPYSDKEEVLKLKGE